MRAVGRARHRVERLDALALSRVGGLRRSLVRVHAEPVQRRGQRVLACSSGHPPLQKPARAPRAAVIAREERPLSADADQRPRRRSGARPQSLSAPPSLPLQVLRRRGLRLLPQQEQPRRKVHR